MLLPDGALVNYIFPNNEYVFWGLTIVTYPYITGLMAGAFVVSALAHLFKVEAFKPIGNFALIAALAFGACAGLPLLVHLGQPQRFYEIYVTPHVTSAMSIFGYVWGGYMVILLLEIWLIYREHIIRMANQTSGLTATIWKALALGVVTYHPEAARIDRKLSTILAGIGIPWAILLHGYVGFIFGSVKAIAWWATPLQPVIFILSAIVSGMAMLMVMYSFIKWWRGEVYEFEMIKVFMTYLWGVFVLTFALEMLEVASVVYENGWHWSQIGPLLAGPLFNSWVIGQVLILSVIPIFLIGYTVLSNISGKPLFYLANLGALMLLTQVLFMRFNVVIGGQLISKSERGFVDYHFELFGHEGVLASAAVFTVPFFFFFILSRYLPILGRKVGQEG